MTLVEGASGNAIVAKPLTIAGPNGRVVRSFSMRDRGVDPLIYFSARQNLLRILLGDMRFIAQFDRNRCLLKMFFVPEYPSEEYRPVREFLTYYGILISRYAGASEAIYQLRAWDDKYQRISWDEGMRLLFSTKKDCLSEYQALLFEKITLFDKALSSERPNLPLAEMRKLVGSATGGRLELRPFVTA
jgi:hypothetical protein